MNGLGCGMRNITAWYVVLPTGGNNSTFKIEVDVVV